MKVCDLVPSLMKVSTSFQLNELLLHAENGPVGSAKTDLN